MASILFLVHHPIQDGSSRYRIFQFLPYLESKGHSCTVRPFSTAKLFRAIRHGGRLATKVAHTVFCSFRRVLDLACVQDYDLVVIHREAFPFFTPLMETMVLQRHPKVIFSFDDALYAGHHNLPNFKYSHLYKWKYGSGVDKVLGAANHVIAGSRVLAEYAAQFNSAVTWIPTVVDLERYEPAPTKAASKPLTIGWYGSDSTSPYLWEIVPALQRLAETYPRRVRFRFFGDPRLRLPLRNQEVYPFQLGTEVSDLRSIDIGIMPMPDNPWTRAKCAFKAIQYMALRMPVVASPVGMVADLIQDGVNGLCARDSNEWFAALDRLVNDAPLRLRLGTVARKTISAEYTLQLWQPRFEALLASIATSQKVLSAGVGA